MKASKLLSLTLLLLAFVIANGQKIKDRDLFGFWSFDQGRNYIEIEFFDSSHFSIRPMNMPNMQNPRKYTLTENNGETLLTLYFDNGGNTFGRQLYLIRKSDSVLFLLQQPDETKSGKPKYKWNKITKKNTLYLYRLERRQAITS